MNIFLQAAQVSSSNSATMSSSSTSVDPVGSLVLGIIFLIVALISYVITGVFLGYVFKKAGVASWIAWVPFYNSWKLLEIGGQPGFWAILTILPLINVASTVFILIAMYNIGLKFGKSGIFVFLAIYLPVVWLIWLAVDSSAWDNKLGTPSKAVEHTGPVPTA